MAMQTIDPVAEQDAAVEKAKLPERMKYSEEALKEYAETIMEAAEIQADPDLMKRLEPYLTKKIQAVKSIEDLKKKYKEVTGRETKKSQGY